MSGPNVFTEYWKREEATRDSFCLESHNGEARHWFRTGDTVVLCQGWRLLAEWCLI